MRKRERGRWAELGHVMWQQPYEAVIALACASGVLQVGRGTASGAATRLYQHWVLDAIGLVSLCGAALTLAGLVACGIATKEVSRVMARRVEQCGQLLLAGVLLALGIAALSSGVRGVNSGALELATACAATARAVMVSRAIARAGRGDGAGYERLMTPEDIAGGRGDPS
jgi:hypothetical protein